MPVDQAPAVKFDDLSDADLLLERVCRIGSSGHGRSDRFRLDQRA